MGYLITNVMVLAGMAFVMWVYFKIKLMLGKDL